MGVCMYMCGCACCNVNLGKWSNLYNIPKVKWHEWEILKNKI